MRGKGRRGEEMAYGSVRGRGGIEGKGKERQ